MNIYRISIPVLVAGTLVAGAASMAQASVGSAHVAKATTARPSGTYSAAPRKGEPAYQSVLVHVDRTAHKVTVDQRCKLNVPGRKLTGTITGRNTFSLSGQGIAGRMTARGHFIDPNGRYFGAVDVTVTNGCGTGSRTWDATLV